MNLAALQLAAPALPLDESGKYVVAAFLVFIALLVIYVGIMAAKLVRIQKAVEQLGDKQPDDDR